jgi:hypothetical protein
VTAGDGVAPGSKAAAAAASASSSSKKAASGHSAKQATAVPESAFERLLKRRASRRLKSAGAAAGAGAGVGSTSSASDSASQPSAESLRATSRQHILRSLFVRELLFSTLTSDQSTSSSDSGAGVELEYAPSNERKKP